MEERTLLSTFVVGNTDDSGPGSLRQAILDSNAAVGATNTIDFDIAGSGVQTIFPLSSLPAIVNPVLIDGFSQAGYAGTPLIEIDGSQAGRGDGLLIDGSDVTVRGLDIGGFSAGAGIHISGVGATGDWIYGDFLGTDPTGTVAGSNDEGVEIDGGATGDLIGTDGDGVNDVAERDVIGGNVFAGVWIHGGGTSGNVVAGDLIGTNVTGDAALPNAEALRRQRVLRQRRGRSDHRQRGVGQPDRGRQPRPRRPRPRRPRRGGPDLGQRERRHRAFRDRDERERGRGRPDRHPHRGNQRPGQRQQGVEIDSGASNNTIGGTGAAARDVISGNGWDAVHIIDPGTTGNVVEGDYLGVTADGEVPLGNVAAGVAIYGGAGGNVVGGMAPGSGDVISANHGFGVYISDAGTADNVVAGDYIGTDASGTYALGNGLTGVYIQSGPATTRSAGRQPRRATSSRATAGTRSTSLTRGPPAMSSRGIISA